MQGFAGAPVDNILAQVKDRLPEVARTAQVDLVARQVDYAGPGVEVVDVTEDPVKRFKPGERTWKMVHALRDQPVLKIEDVAVMPASH